MDDAELRLECVRLAYDNCPNGIHEFLLEQAKKIYDWVVSGEEKD